MTRIRLRDLRGMLLRVQMPGRYVGGEVGVVRKPGEGYLDVAISYPDLYEVGMSNTAVKILYRGLNAVDGVRCERVFAVAPDFEAELRAGGVPLYTLETGIPLRELDVLGFSVGYELCLTNLLAILDLGGIPIRAAARAEGDPIVLAGGPAVTNPAPLGRFVDCVFVGEAEGRIEELFAELARVKRAGGGRSRMLETLRADTHVWFPGREGVARRAVWSGFGQATGGASAPVKAPDRRPPFPVASIRCVQDEGTLEIMRGCPNGCRFCNAGVLYRPFRVKEPEEIVREVERLVFDAGYDEITLASLSSADYPGLSGLVRFLNERYAPFGVSFSLPSLRVSGVTLDLMEGISEVRKSGLTFAVETPLEPDQRAVNKPVPMDRVIDLLLEAKARGWHKAKFYFMIGLPPSVDRDETGPIASFLRQVRGRTGMELHVNINTFVPKPHTPFQWARQLGEGEALERINAIRLMVGRGGVRIGYHAPFLSVLEGVVARGDERAAALVEEAFRRGARLDAWDEYRQWDLWRAVLAEAGWDVVGEVARERGTDEALPWDGVNLGVGKAFLAREAARAREGILTAACAASCGESCGACGRGVAVRDRGWSEGDAERIAASLPAPPYRGARAAAAGGAKAARVVFSFRKEGPAAFISHLNVMTVFSRAFRRARLSARLSEGFNPKPRLEIASPLPLGLESAGEIGGVELYDYPGDAVFVEAMNRVLPEGVVVTGAAVRPEPPPDTRRLSLMAEYWGADYRVELPPAWLEPALRGAESAGGAVARVWAEPEGLCFRLKQSGESSAGVLKALLAITGHDALKEGLRLRRMRVLRMGAAGEPEAMG